MFKLPLFLIVIVLNVSCENDRLSEVLRSEIEHLESKNDSLTDELDRIKFSRFIWFDNEHEGARFLEKGIINPVQFIENSLRNKPELIPLKAVLGGTMTFDRIQLLSDKWLIADYSDGHIDGVAIYEFTLSINNEISFKLLHRKTPEY